MFQVKDNALGYIKYVGISRAVVVDNNDPLKRGRIRVNSPVLGETAWIPYLTTPGTFNVPAIDTIVYIQCDGGFYTHPVAWGNFNYGEDNDLKFPKEFQRVSPTNRGFYTPGNHLIELDDGTDTLGTGSGIRVTTANGIILNIDDFEDKVTIDTNNGEHLELSKAEGIQLSTPDNGGTSASFKAGKIDLEANSDITITSDTGAYNIDINGDIIYTTSSGDFKVTASAGDVILEASGGAKLKLSSGMVGLGSASAELVDLVDQLLDQVDQTEDGIIALTVPTAVGPSGPPINSATFVGIKANLATIKGLLEGIKGGI